LTGAPEDLLKKLAGGDRRSVRGVAEVVGAVRKTPTLFGTLFEGMLAGDPVVRMRAAGAARAVPRAAPVTSAEIQRPPGRSVRCLKGSSSQTSRSVLSNGRS